MARTLSSVGKQANPCPEYYKDLKKRKMPTLHLVDSNNWACRAYFAMKDRQIFAKKSKEPIAGVVAWISMIRQFVDFCNQHDRSGQYFGFCWDPKSDTTWRYRAQQMWAEEHKKEAKIIFSKKGKSFSPMYKGTRDRSKHPDMAAQIDLMRHILDLNGFKILRKAPYECDDLVGTLAIRFAKMCFVDMYSVDKDYLQLIVSKKVRLIMQAQSNRAAQVHTFDTAVNFFGVRPDQIVDFLAMCGDGVDNVPGLPGVAEGTAAKLLNKYGTFDNLLSDVDNIKGNNAWLRALKGQEPMMEMDLMRELVTITKNVPRMPRKLSEFNRTEPNTKALNKLKRELGIDVTI